MNKEKKKNYFPNNLRFITENPISVFLAKNRVKLLIGFVSLLIFLGIITVSIDLYMNYKTGQRYLAERSKIEKEVTFWDSVVQKYPNYRDAYFKLAVLNYQLKNFGKSREYLGKVLRIDPNFKEARKLEKILIQ